MSEVNRPSRMPHLGQVPDWIAQTNAYMDALEAEKKCWRHRTWCWRRVIRTYSEIAARSMDQVATLEAENRELRERGPRQTPERRAMVRQPVETSGSVYVWAEDWNSLLADLTEAERLLRDTRNELADMYANWHGAAVSSRTQEADRQVLAEIDEFLKESP